MRAAARGGGGEGGVDGARRGNADRTAQDKPARAPIRHRCEGRLMHKRLRSIHRWASLTMMAFWLVQALTGMLLVFSWELDDATVSAPHVPTDLTAIDAALARITAAHPGTRIAARSEEPTSELQSLMRPSYADFR